LITKEQNRFFIETFGCQMNVNDSEKVAGLLEAEGYVAAASPDDADFVFLNTCAVREKASEKLRHSLDRLRHRKRRNPDLRIGVGGCVTQLHGDSILARTKGADIVVGTHTLSRVPEMLGRVRSGEGLQVDLDRKADAFAVPAAVVSHSHSVRAYVTVMEGCNHVCSFCVVPRTRGPEVNRAPEDVVAEVESLVDRGYSEVMLLGQTVNAYQHGDVDFAELLRRVSAVGGLRRLRFTTSHPAHMTETVAEALGELPTVCPHIHLPVQSGSDRILDSMRRGYTAEQYRRIAARLRRHRPDLALSSDVIVGYPGETAEDFEATVDLVDEIGFSGLFVFTYSPRPGTTALRLADDVPDDEKLRRLKILNDRQQRRQAEQNARRVGSIEEVLVDTVGDDGRVAGRTRDFRIVHMPAPDEALAEAGRGDATSASSGQLSKSVHASSSELSHAVPTSLLGRFLQIEIIHSGPNSLVGRPTNTPNCSLTQVSSVPIF
jgi:tRNA-2-methylthio-N6-dimethylallyladenosine synthase